MEIVGVVQFVVYESADLLYKVIKVKTKDGTITVTGPLAGIQEGPTYKFLGDMIVDKRFGEQFKATSYSLEEAQDEEALIKYLSGPTFSGIGEVTAKKIVSALGLDALKIIKEDISKLIEIKGISKEKALVIQIQVKQNFACEEIFVKLYSLGLSQNAAKKIYQRYLLDTFKVIEDNPYILCRELDNFGFVKADEIALKLGIEENSPKRIREAILYTLNNYTYMYGFTYMYEDQILDETIKLLNARSTTKFTSLDLSKLFIELINDNLIYKIDSKIFPKELYLAETNAAKRILEILAYDFKLSKNIDKIIEVASKSLDFNLTSEQKSAIKNALSNKISIITGGPGTGKTTILKCLLLSYANIEKKSINSEEFAKSILLLSPTGKASKRLASQTGMEAKTIHKALEYDETGYFNKGLSNKLDANLIIIDESSMIDITLLSHLLDAIKPSSKIVFVGDTDQLPSVGPGNVLGDLINSNKISVSYLTQILRQKAESKIIRLAHDINSKGLDMNIFNDKKELFFYETTEGNITNLIIKIVERYLALGKDIYQDLQILCPMYLGSSGIDNINSLIQEKFNKSTDIIKYQNKIFKVNDKVLNLTNKPDLDIMNGQTGIIKGFTKVDGKTILNIAFDTNIVEYPYEDLDNLTLGYAISIHKSQGSEFLNVIMPISRSFRRMLKRKLIYTAVTRAKEKLILIGDSNELLNSLYQEESERQTNLDLFLNPSLNKKDEIEEDTNDDIILIDDPLSAFDTLDEALCGITPYSFMEDNND